MTGQPGQPRRLGDRGLLALTHCGQPPARRHDTTSWAGSYPDGCQHDVQVYRCLACGAVITIAQAELDRRPSP